MLAPLRDELDALLRSSPLHDLLGIEVVSWEPGTARLRLAPGPEQANFVGSVHGGVLFSLADAALEVACNAYGRACVALETACHYVAPAAVGEVLLAEATEVSRSRRVASYRIDVRAADESGGGDLRSWYMALAYRTERWHLGAERWPEDWRAAH